MRLNGVYFNNRWRKSEYSRPDDWTIIGVHVHWASPYDYNYRFCFFGFSVSFWFKRN